MSTSKSSKPDEASYHHGNLRAALVDGGLALLEESGADEFSLRELARRVGVSANAAYRHFENREALLAALAAEGFRRFAAAQMAALQGQADALAAFLAAGHSYVDFARANPALFRLMFGRFGAGARSQEMTDAGELALQGLRQGIATVLGKRADEPGVDVAALHAWSLVHGLSHLALDGQLARHAEDEDALVDAVLRQALALGSPDRRKR